MSMADDLARFTVKLETRSRDVFVGSVGEVKTSITEGSAVTGAPGQPVDSGTLVRSFQETYPEEWVGQVATNVGYALVIEDGQVTDHEVRAHTRTSSTGTTHAVSGHFRRGRIMRFLSPVGGPHSVKLTRAGWQRVVNHVTRAVKGGA